MNHILTAVLIEISVLKKKNQTLDKCLWNGLTETLKIVQYRIEFKEYALESATEPPLIWKKPKHKSWVTPEIEELMKRRRKMKISNNEREYADLNREIEMKFSQSKDDYLNDKCLKIEQI